MLKKIYVFVLMILSILLLFGCKKQEKKIDENKDVYVEMEISKPSISVRDETKEKVTEIIDIDGLGKVTFIRSTTSSMKSIQSLQPAKGDVVIVGDYKYTFQKVYNGTTYQDIENLCFSVIANEKKETYEQPLSSLFGIDVLYADYCYYQNDILTDVSILPAKLISASHCFDGCLNLKDTNLNNMMQRMTSIKNISYMFANCKSINSIEFSNLSITDMEGTFLNCENLKSISELPNYVEKKDKCFDGCGSLSEQMKEEFLK